MAQNAVRASEATVAETFSEVRSSCDQLPFMVSQNPYITAKTANSQNAAGSGPRRPGEASARRPAEASAGPAAAGGAGRRKGQPQAGQQQGGGRGRGQH